WVGYAERKMSEVALIAPTYECGDVGYVGCFVFHSGGIITWDLVGWKGRWGSEQYVSCMFRLLVYFQFLVVRIAGLSESLKAQRTLKNRKYR
ncbi:MAG: hypothetical protein OXD54_19110, partial [Candidatus Poribacteria bacterium]|nr:hypothetical protein [Candidatus Poribacteria bacterium]